MKIKETVFWILMGFLTGSTIELFFLEPTYGERVGVITFLLFLFLGGLDHLASLFSKRIDNSQTAQI